MTLGLAKRILGYFQWHSTINRFISFQKEIENSKISWHQSSSTNIQICTSELKHIRRVGLQAHCMGKSFSKSRGKIFKHISCLDFQAHQKGSSSNTSEEKIYKNIRRVELQAHQRGRTSTSLVSCNSRIEFCWLFQIAWISSV